MTVASAIEAQNAIVTPGADGILIRPDDSGLEPSVHVHSGEHTLVLDGEFDTLLVDHHAEVTLAKPSRLKNIYVYGTLIGAATETIDRPSRPEQVWRPKIGRFIASSVIVKGGTIRNALFTTNTLLVTGSSSIIRHCGIEAHGIDLGEGRFEHCVAECDTLRTSDKFGTGTPSRYQAQLSESLLSASSVELADAYLVDVAFAGHILNFRILRSCLVRPVFAAVQGGVQQRLSLDLPTTCIIGPVDHPEVLAPDDSFFDRTMRTWYAQEPSYLGEMSTRFRLIFHALTPSHLLGPALWVLFLLAVAVYFDESDSGLAHLMALPIYLAFAVAVAYLYNKLMPNVAFTPTALPQRTS